MNDKLYNILKYTQRIAIPAILAFFLALAHMFDWKCGETVAGVTSAFLTLLGVFLENRYREWVKEHYV
jgi:hypothetical protein